VCYARPTLSCDPGHHPTGSCSVFPLTRLTTAFAYTSTFHQLVGPQTFLKRDKHPLSTPNLHRPPPSPPTAALSSPIETSQPHPIRNRTEGMLQESMTFKSESTSGTTSSKASSLFDLDQNCVKSILVYKYRSGAKGLEVKTERDLCTELDQGTFSVV